MMPTLASKLFDADARIDARPLLLIVLSGCALRVAWALLVPVVPMSDSFAYDTFARNLVEHRVFGWTAAEPFAFWSPGTSLLYAAIYSVVGFSHSALVALHIAASAVLIASVGRVTARFFGANAGLVAAALIAVWPTLVMYTTVLASELLFVAFTTLAFDVWTSRFNVLWRGVAAGILIGIAALIRPLALALPFLLPVAMVFQLGVGRSSMAAQAKIAFLSAVFMALTVAPWTWRNYQLFDEPVLVSTNGRITFWMGNTPGTDGMNVGIPEELYGLPENEQAAVLSDRAWAYIREAPLAFVGRTAWKLGILFGYESIGIAWNLDGIVQTYGERAATVLKWFTHVAWAAIFGLAIAGVTALIRARGFLLAVTSPFVVAIAFYSAVHALTVAADRYHLSFAGHIATLSAVGFVALRSLWLARRERS